ncbi:MAG: hypothetical protein HYU63_03500 [Armatimonadetes bacterium]|nr:hypothetical protein [Armatimonadota bacterium]
MINLLKTLLLSLILLLCLFTNFAFAKNLKEEKKYEILINAKSMQYDEKKQLLNLENPRFTYKDIIITAPYAEYDYKKNIGNLTGGIKITQPETILTAKEMNY